jgi:hypothetical protein
MKAVLWTRKDVAVVTGISILVLIVAVLTVRFAEAETPSSVLGSDWRCHRLPYIEICNHTSQ